MKPGDYQSELNAHLSHLYTFARQVNELDFAVSLGGEFRGAQDAGWATTITANEVFEELGTFFSAGGRLSKAEFRAALMLYCQLAEAGGFYETLKNMMGVISLKPYVLWPFQPLVRVRKEPKRVIGPNANATFRDLATMARSIGLLRLSELLVLAFRDDIRNGITHADYVIWDDGLRLRKRNGGRADRLSFKDVSDAICRGMIFFQILKELNNASVRTFDPPKEIVGRFSVNPPMPWTVSYNPKSGAFGISGSSPGAVTTPQYDRQVEINNRLGGKVFALYSRMNCSQLDDTEAHALSQGFEPHGVEISDAQMEALAADIERIGLWDDRQPHIEQSHVLLASPWGFRWLHSPSEFDALLGQPLLEFEEASDQAGGSANAAK